MRIIFFIFCFVFAFANENLKNSMKWGEDLDGVLQNLQTNQKVLALSFDLCGSKTDGFDEKIVSFLEKNKIKATFFVNYRWIKKYPDFFERLYKNPLFEIENHGTKHLPASSNGNFIYGIKGTNNLDELHEEIIKNADLIEKITAKRPKFYRSGTAYYDEIAIDEIYKLGFKPLGFSVLGDGGATYSANKVKNTLLKSKNGDIIILHANRPKSGTANGLILAIPLLLEQGFSFVRLDEYLD